ncbi:MAG: cellulase family glycosylhydrolase [Saprospiraceae bacterium]|nr:cellulase family glycosylhydrolase [Saprospiraceae bacterium]
MNGLISSQTFVEIRDGYFSRGDNNYFIAGINLWYAMHLGAEVIGDRPRLITELDQLANMGINNVRIMATAEGPDTEPWRIKPSVQPEPGQYSEQLLTGLDFVLLELGKRQMTAVVCLTNFWPWSGGMAQYVAWSEKSVRIPYPPPEKNGSWIQYQLYTSRFYTNDNALNWYRQHIRKILLRENNYTGTLYRDDPTIMSWELANEPRAILKPRKYRKWISQSAEFIKELDPNHLVTIGSEGNTSSKWSGNRFFSDHQCAFIDYCTIHIWPENWGWYDPEKTKATYEDALQKTTAYIRQHVREATRLAKPLVLEEFGLARDEGSYSPTATTVWRDRFFKEVCMEVFAQMHKNTPLAGVNFWAWSGEGRPEVGGSFWHTGQPFCGDPPHEKQGWYSIYSSDFSTHQIISDFAERLRTLRR